MFVETTSFYLIFAIAWFAPISLMTAGCVLLRGRRVGGLTFCRLGPIGFSFYIRRR